MGKFLTTPIGSALRVFAGALLGGLVLFLSNGNSLSDLNFDVLNTVLSTATVVSVPLLIAAINPADPRWGRGPTTPGG